MYTIFEAFGVRNQSGTSPKNLFQRYFEIKDFRLHCTSIAFYSKSQETNVFYSNFQHRTWFLMPPNKLMSVEKFHLKIR